MVGTDVLKAYGGAVGEGVGTRKFGNAVATVADAAEKKEATASGDSTGAVAFRRGKRPICGGSFVSIPKLQKGLELLQSTYSTTYLKTLYTVRRKADPSCQSMPSALGREALGQLRQRSGEPSAGPMM